MPLSEYLLLSWFIPLIVISIPYLRTVMDSSKKDAPEARGQAGPSPALSGASPAPMEIGLTEAETHQFTAEEAALMDAELGVEVLAEVLLSIYLKCSIILSRLINVFVSLFTFIRPEPCNSTTSSLFRHAGFGLDTISYLGFSASCRGES